MESKREKTDAEKLEEYIMKLFNYDYVPPKIKKQINQYMKEYNYTYSGIHKALIYFYEVKNGDINKSYDSIGIVPYVYQNAYNYYYSLWLAQQKNNTKELDLYLPKVEEIIITPPRRDPIKRKLFTFLDEEEVAADG